MKRSLLTVLCLGFVGAAAAHAQSVPTSQTPLFISNLSADSISSVTGPATLNPAFAPTGGGIIDEPNGIAANGDGTIYAATFTRPTTPTITRFSASTGAVLSTFSFPAVPNGLTFGPNGSLYAVTNIEPNSGNGAVYEINPSNGGLNRIANSPLLNGGDFGGPLGIAFGPDGNIYLADTDNNSILRVTLGGVVTLAYQESPANSTFSALAAPTGLVFDATGRLFVTNNTSDAVTFFGTDILTSQAGASQASSNLFARDGNSRILEGPSGITFSPDGTNLFVTTDRGLVNQIDGAGVITTFATGDATLGLAFLTFSPVPEPSTYAMFAVAGIGMAVFGIRRRMATHI